MTIGLSMYAGGRTGRRTVATMALALGENAESREQGYTVMAKMFSENVKLEIFAPPHSL